MIAGNAQLARLADEDLLTLVQRSDAEAFEIIYDRHSRVAYSLAYRMLGDQSAAEDLVQEAMLAIWRNAASYSTGRGSVRTWILSIVHNRGIDQLRRNGAAARRQEALEHVEERRPQEDDTADRGIRRVMTRTVQGEMDELPPDQSEVLKLAYYAGFTQQEISEMLDLPLGTVKSRMRLGLNRLRRGIGSIDEVIA